jgi:osmotically-inducible protein OsmY
MTLEPVDGSKCDPVIHQGCEHVRDALAAGDRLMANRWLVTVQDRAATLERELRSQIARLEREVAGLRGVQ